MTKNKGLNDSKPPPLPGFVVGKKAEPGGSFEEMANDFLEKSRAKKLTIDEFFDTFTKLHDVFQREFEEACQQTGLSLEFLSGYLSNSNNFSEEDWKFMKEEQQALREKYQPKIEKLGLPTDLLEKIAKKTGQDLSSGTKPFTESLSEGKGDKKIRSKSAGERRKWIPMR